MHSISAKRKNLCISPHFSFGGSIKLLAYAQCIPWTSCVSTQFSVGLYVARCLQPFCGYATQTQKLYGKKSCNFNTCDKFACFMFHIAHFVWNVNCLVCCCSQWQMLYVCEQRSISLIHLLEMMLNCMRKTSHREGFTIYPKWLKFILHL